LGVVEIDLSSFADPAVGSAAPTEHSFPLTKSFINGAFLYVTIVPKVMSTDSSSDMQDDTMSMQSGFSDAPVISADFGIASFPQYPTTTSPDKVAEEEEEEEETREEVALELHQKIIEFGNLEDDYDLLSSDHAQSQEELAAACKALDQLHVHVQQQLESKVEETDCARASRVTLTRIMAGTSMSSSDEDTISNLKEVITALLAELEAQNQMHAAFSQVFQIKETRLAESEARNLHLLGKINQVSERNIALKALAEISIPKEEYEGKRRKHEDEYQRQITDLTSTKRNAETELERQVEDNNDLKRRLQLYSENVAELEVNGAANHTHTFVQDSPTKRTPERRTSQMEGLEEAVIVTYEGSLTKRGSFYPSWKSRHFILHGDSQLSYYTNQDDMVFKGHFILTNDTVLGEATVSGYKCFYLEHSKRRLYMTAASTLEEMEWVAVFRRSIGVLSNNTINSSNSNNI
jgi:hypothetical protein